ncbi:Hypothetical predicted protein [Lecanosticta acicola]|uniref:Uncharacterized protein n=1 Tax=Lecanosticta acicola TaxID=111012 RepID=A0AAI9ECF4_9PEZI|nr:Hypothetical predicted protein [Lecanosticta acicola]
MPENNMAERLTAAIAAEIKRKADVQSVSTKATADVEDAQLELTRITKESEVAKAKASRDLTAIKARITELSRLLVKEEEDVEKDKLEELLRPVVIETELPPPEATINETSADGEPRQKRTSTAPGTTAPSRPARSGRKPTQHTHRGGPFSELAEDSTDAQLNAMLDDCPDYTSLPQCTIIVKGKGEGEEQPWYELQCPECHGNWSDSHGGSLLKGVAGMATHVQKSHQYEKKDLSDPVILELCNIRTVEKDELHHILRGGHEGGLYVEQKPLETTVSTSCRAVVKKQNEYTEDWKFVKDKKHFVGSCPCIVQHPEGHWVLLECPVCHGNYTRNGGYLQNGVKGFQDHLFHAHGELRMTSGPRKIIDRCFVKNMTEDEVLQIKKAEPGAPLPAQKLIKSTIPPKSTIPAKRDVSTLDDSDSLINNKSTRSGIKRQVLSNGKAASTAYGADGDQDDEEPPTGDFVEENEPEEEEEQTQNLLDAVEVVEVDDDESGGNETEEEE